jgi:hypothetical protein
VDDGRLDNDVSILEELADSGSGVGVGDLGGLLGVEPDLSLTDAGDVGSQTEGERGGGSRSVKGARELNLKAIKGGGGSGMRGRSSGRFPIKGEIKVCDEGGESKFYDPSLVENRIVVETRLLYGYRCR